MSELHDSEPNSERNIRGGTHTNGFFEGLYDFQNFMFVRDGNTCTGSAEFGESVFENLRRVRGVRYCVSDARFDADTSWVKDHLATDAAVEVLDEVDKRAFWQDNNSAATRSSARKSFQDEYGKGSQAPALSQAQEHRAENPQTFETTVLPC